MHTGTHLCSSLILSATQSIFPTEMTTSNEDGTFTLYSYMQPTITPKAEIKGFEKLKTFRLDCRCVCDETEEDIEYMNKLFKALEHSKQLKSLSFQYVYYYVKQKKYSKVVYSISFKMLLRLNRLQILSVSVDRLNNTQNCQIWRYLSTLNDLKSCTYSLFNKTEGSISPYLYDNKTKIKLDSLTLTAYVPTFDIYILARFAKNIEYKKINIYLNAGGRMKRAEVKQMLSLLVLDETKKLGFITLLTRAKSVLGDLTSLMISKFYEKKVSIVMK